VHKYAPVLNQRIRRELRAPNCAAIQPPFANSKKKDNCAVPVGSALAATATTELNPTTAM
jgi:hypothetical protein